MGIYTQSKTQEADSREINSVLLHLIMTSMNWSIWLHMIGAKLLGSKEDEG